MIVFDVLNRFSGTVQFTAEIGASESDARCVKLGLAVKWAVANRANLDGANLDGASLYGANLARASLARVNLARANLARANLDGADLYGASLYGANLARANLARASLDGASGINDYVKCIQIEQYPITYTDTTLQIGCQCHKITKWADFDDHQISEMDGKAALKFWRKYKSWIFQTIEICPAKPTGFAATEETE